ncbi:hypothetical protein BD779DRAFT_1610959 [Infundibulicybe gibba]|nr:hypothetical protein BD779DRAFT_1610959 [Infundibulicybe gibba]
MHAKTVSRFSGERSDSVQPDDFLKDVKNSFHEYSNLSDADRIEIFANNLKSRSVAEDWFNDSIAPTKANWREVQQAFVKRFPPVRRSKKTSAEYQRELSALKLTTAELGKKVTYAGEELWSHIAFAYKLLDLAEKAGIADTDVNVWRARDELPDVIKEEVKEEQANWRAFCAAIEETSHSRIRDGVAKHEAHEKERAEVQQLRDQLNRLQVSGTNSRTAARPASNVASPTTTTTNTRPANNPAAASRQRLPLSEEERALVFARADAWPMQQDTPEGKTAWEGQRRAWKAQFGENARVTPRTGYPLRPGGAPLFSGECYRCGKTGHRRPDCTATEVTSCWAPGMSRVNAVGEEAADEFGWENNVGRRDDQGNGEGPSA